MFRFTSRSALGCKGNLLSDDTSRISSDLKEKQSENEKEHVYKIALSIGLTCSCVDSRYN